MDNKKSNSIIQKNLPGLQVNQDIQHQFKKKAITNSADSGNENISTGHSIDQLKKKYMGNSNTTGGPVKDAMKSNPSHEGADTKKEKYNVVVVEEKNKKNDDSVDDSVKKRTYIIEDDDIKAAQG